MEAYNLDSDQISSPAWVRDEQYRLQAKLPPNTNKEQFRLMLQHLLEARFHLTLHHETRNASGYDLMVTPGGPALKPAPPIDSNAKPLTVAQRRAIALDPDAFPTLPPGTRMSSISGGGLTRITCRTTMPQFAEELGRMIRAANGDAKGAAPGALPLAPRVSDKTGIDGEFEFHLKFADNVALPRNLPILS